MRQQESELLKAFRVMDPETQEIVLHFARSRVNKQTPAPALTLVGSDPSSSAYLSRTARKIKN
jgi:hypothetical protein